MEDIRSKTKAFFAPLFQSYELRDDEDVFALGFVNSLFIMQLILFMESEFAIKLEREQINLDNFRTINAIVRMVERCGVLVPQL